MKRIFFILCMAISLISFSQEQISLTKADITLAVDSLSASLNRIYVFPDKAKEMSDLIQKNLKDGKYDALTDPFLFGEQITKDIQSISKDKHLAFRFAPQRISDMRKERNAAAPDISEMKKEMGRDNFGFEEVKILPGNIGYIKFNGFVDAAIGGDAASAAMNFVAYTDAIIFDIRDNGGGSPSMIQLLTSYLYRDGEEIHLNNFYFRPENRTTQTWTLPYIPGKRNPDAQVYVLTSNYTFSAAEEFTYNLKNLNRGTIVGETTGGGAHPGGFQIISDYFFCFIPNGRAINPITQTNWEGTGIKPDIESTRDNALLVAQEKALDSLAKSTDDEMRKNRYEWAKMIVQSQINPYQADVKKMKLHVGKYGPRSLVLENNVLNYQREGRPKFVLTALTDNIYYNSDLGLKVEVIMKDGKSIAIEVTTEDGRKERNEKN